MIKKYKSKYRTVVLDILSQTLGKGYIKDLEEILDREEVHALVALEGKRIVGFGYGCIANKDWLKQITPYLECKIPPDIHDVCDSALRLTNMYYRPSLVFSIS